MSKFDRLDRLASAAVDDVFGERFLFVPMAGEPNGRPACEAGRPETTGDGVFDRRSAETAGRGRPPMQTLMGAQVPRLNVGRAAFGGQMPRQGDLIIMQERGSEFTVVSVEEDGRHRLTLTLAARGH